jgi:cation transport ATPase
MRPTASATVHRAGELVVTDATLFGGDDDGPARLFAARVLRVPELRALVIDPARAAATLRYCAPRQGAAAVIHRLADAAAAGAPLPDQALPPWRRGQCAVLHRYRDIISTLEIISAVPGRLRACHPTLRREPKTAQLVMSRLRAAAGVRAVTVTTLAVLDVRFEPAQTTAQALLRVAESVLAAPAELQLADGEHPNDALPTISLAVAAVGELVAPVVLPAAAALLVLTGVDTVRAGTRQLRNGELGLPVLYSGVVACTLLSGSYLSAALMFWFLRQWERRHFADMAAENTALLGEILRVPEQARVVTADGAERMVSCSEIDAGQHVRVLPGETIPVDGSVASGAAVVSEARLGRPVRRTVAARGDEVYAGSAVHVGQLELSVLRTGRSTREAKLAQAVLDITVPQPSRWALSAEGEAFGDATVGPTIAVAAAAMLTGGVAAANSVLRLDCATGIGLAAPLRTLRANRIALRHGALVRAHSALDRLARSRWLLLDDHEELAAADFELSDAPLRAPDENRLLTAAAAASAWLGDARGLALSRVCAQRGLIARHGELQSASSDGVAVRVGADLVQVQGRSGPGEMVPLRVRIDGAEPIELRFKRNGHVPAATTLEQIRRLGVRIFLASGRSEKQAGRRARLLGADAYAGRIDDRARSQLLRALRQRGVPVLHLREGVTLSNSDPDYVSAGLVNPDGIHSGVDFALLGRSIAPLPALIAVARESTAHSRTDRLTVTLPNIAAAAGVIGLGFTGLTVVLISNLATYVAQERARRSLIEAREHEFAGPDLDALGVDSGSALAPGIAGETRDFEQRRAYA